MADLKKKVKLMNLLKKLGDTNVPETPVFEALLQEFNLLKQSMPKVPDIDPLKRDIHALGNRYTSLSLAISTVTSSIADLREGLTNKAEIDNQSFRKALNNLSGSIEKLGIDLEKAKQQQTKIISYAGGNMNRNILVNGVNILARYTDINFKGSGVTYTAVNNNTTKQVDLTLTSTGTGGFSALQEKSTTSPNGATTTFTFTHTPTFIYWNGALQTLTDDYTVSGNNITFTASAGVPQTNDKIINTY